MIREEQIKQAAKIRADQYEHPAQWSDTYYGFISGAEWADKTLINKACKWLKENKDNYAYPVYEGDTLTDECFVGESLIDDFRKAMEE